MSRIAIISVDGHVRASSQSLDIAIEQGFLLEDDMPEIPALAAASFPL